MVRCIFHKDTLSLQGHQLPTPSPPLSLHCKDREFPRNFDVVPKYSQLKRNWTFGNRSYATYLFHDKIDISMQSYFVSHFKDTSYARSNEAKNEQLLDVLPDNSANRPLLIELPNKLSMSCSF